MVAVASQFHGIGPNRDDGDGQFFFASAQFIRKLETLYALPHLGFRSSEAETLSWPYHTFERPFYFAAEKYWKTVHKIDRVAELIDDERRNVRDLRPGEIPVADMARHLGALTDIPIYLETLIVYLRAMADTIANLTPHLYGQRGKHLTRDSFRTQREWFVSKRPTFDPEYTEILLQHTRWFDALAGNSPHMGLRDAIIHYRGGIQIMYRPTRTEEPADLFASLFSDDNTLTHDLFSLLKLVVADMFAFLDRFTAHFATLANARTNSSAFDLNTPDVTVFFLYKGRLPLAWLYPSITSPIT